MKKVKFRSTKYMTFLLQNGRRQNGGHQNGSHHEWFRSDCIHFIGPVSNHAARFALHCDSCPATGCLLWLSLSGWRSVRLAAWLPGPLPIWFTLLLPHWLAHCPVHWSTHWLAHCPAQWLAHWFTLLLSQRLAGICWDLNWLSVRAARTMLEPEPPSKLFEWLMPSCDLPY